MPQDTSSWAHHVHTVVIIGWTLVATAFFATVCLFVSFFSRNGDAVHILARLWCKTILAVAGIKVKIKGLENIDPRGPYIFMANHQSNFDIPVLLGCLPVQFRWLAKAELFKIPIFGPSMEGAGYISIDRSNRRAAFKSLAKAADTIRRGTSVMIFPEGTRSSDGRLQPFKKGGFVLAVDARVPVVPVVIKGTYEIMPRQRLLIRPRPVTIIIEKPIDTTSYTRRTKDKLMDRVWRALASHLPAA